MKDGLVLLFLKKYTLFIYSKNCLSKLNIGKEEIFFKVKGIYTSKTLELDETGLGRRQILLGWRGLSWGKGCEKQPDFPSTRGTSLCLVPAAGNQMQVREALGCWDGSGVHVTLAAAMVQCHPITQQSLRQPQSPEVFERKGALRKAALGITFLSMSKGKCLGGVNVPIMQQIERGK